MKCPKCGGRLFRVSARQSVSVTVRYSKSDSDEIVHLESEPDGGSEWEDDSSVECRKCGYDGRAAEFEGRGPELEAAEKGKQAYRDAARRIWHKDGEVEVDNTIPDRCKVSLSPGVDEGGAEGRGAYVQAWVWVYEEDLALG